MATQVDNLSIGSVSAVDTLTRASFSGVDNSKISDGALITADGELSIVGSNISVDDTSRFESSGTLKIRTDAGEQEFDYTGKDAATLTGCTIAAGTFAYVTNDRVEKVYV